MSSTLRVVLRWALLRWAFSLVIQLFLACARLANFVPSRKEPPSSLLKEV